MCKIFLRLALTALISQLVLAENTEIKSLLRGNKEFRKFPPIRRLGHLSEHVSNVNRKGIAEFKRRNQLKQDADPIIQEIHPNGGVFVAGQHLSVKKKHLKPISVFTDTALLLIDGVEKPPVVSVFSSKKDHRLSVTFEPNDGNLMGGVFYDYRTGEAVDIEPIDDKNCIFANVERNDVDDDKLRNFDIADIPKSSDPKPTLRSGKNIVGVIDNRIEDVGSCSSRGYNIIEVAVVVDSSFCSGNEPRQVEAQVQAVMNSASRFFEIDGLCKKLKISYLEINCKENEDPIQKFLKPSAQDKDVCSNSGASLLDGFAQYTRDKKIRADLNVLFHGTDFRVASIGCAYVATVCRPSGFNSGVNYMKFSSNTFQQAKLIAHEIGHIVGADHVSSQEDIMYPSLCQTCGRFGKTSQRSINAAVHAGRCATLNSSGGNGAGQAPTPAPTLSPTKRPSLSSTRSPTKAPNRVRTRAPSRSPPGAPSCTDSSTFAGFYGLTCASIKHYTGRSQWYICHWFNGFGENCPSSCRRC